MIEQKVGPTPRTGVVHTLVEVLKHRWATIVGLAIGAVGVWDGSDVSARFAVATVIMAAAYVPIGVLRRQFRAPRDLLVELAGVLVFGGLALAALLVDGPPAYYLLAAAWFGHGVWDAVHHWANRVVPRWYAELCAIIDLCIALGLLVAAR